MVGDDVRAARERAGLSQSELARIAKVPRSQLRKLEENKNVTLQTLYKVIDQLPGMDLTVGPPRQIDSDAVRQALTELVAAAQRLLGMLGTQPPLPVEELPAPTPIPQRTHEGPVGATRHEPTVDPELIKRLEAVIDDIEQGKLRKKAEH